MLEVAIFGVAVIVYGRWRLRIDSWILIASKWAVRFARNHKTCKVAETFFTEAAVLWFVFPILDTIYERKGMSDPKLLQAYVAAIVCFVAAVALSHAGKEN